MIALEVANLRMAAQNFGNYVRKFLLPRIDSFV